MVLLLLAAVAVAVALGIASLLGFIGHGRRAVRAAANGTVATHQAPAHYAVVSWIALGLLPVLFGLWFVVGSLLIGDPNEPNAPTGLDAAWRVIVLWLIVMIVPATGVLFGWRAAHHNESSGRAALIANSVLVVLLTALTLGGGLIDAFT